MAPALEEGWPTEGTSGKFLFLLLSFLTVFVADQSLHRRSRQIRRQWGGGRVRSARHTETLVGMYHFIDFPSFYRLTSITTDRFKFVLLKDNHEYGIECRNYL